MGDYVTRCARRRGAASRGGGRPAGHRARPGRTGPRPLPAVAGGLGDVFAALQAVGARFPLCPVPGQLAALCSSLNVADGHAAAAAVLPELDGITLAILGLHNCAGSTVVHMHASGPICHVSHELDELYYWPVIWIRDCGWRWHTTHARSRNGMNGEVALRLEVVPLLNRATAWVEVLAAGQSAQTRATLRCAGSEVHAG